MFLKSETMLLPRCAPTRGHCQAPRAYLEPIARLRVLARISRRAPLGIAVLILPYRQPLLTARVVLVWLRRRLDAANHGVDVVMQRPIGCQYLGSPRIRRVRRVHLGPARSKLNLGAALVWPTNAKAIARRWGRFTTLSFVAHTGIIT